MLINLINDGMFRAEDGFRHGKDYEEVFEDVRELFDGEFDDEMVDMLVSRIIKDSEDRIGVF